MSFQLGREQLDWARTQYANDSQIVGRVVDAAMERAEINDAAADRDRARYEEIFQPIENQLAQEAADFSTPDRMRMEAERAQSTVAQNFEGQRRAAIQNLESFGVDPSATRYMALDAGSRVAEAAAKAGAGNQSRAQTEAVGRALRSEAINVGKGYPGQIAGTYATALQSGNQAGNTQLAGTASGAGSMGTGPQWMGAGNTSLNTWGNTLNMGYNNALSAAEFNSQQSSGIGGLLGAGLGAIGNAGGLAAFFEEGGMASMPPDRAIPVGSGGGVPAISSPSGGRAIDDVPARLTPGEFVVPNDVVSWKGEEFFQRLIESSRKAKPEAVAQPDFAPAAPQPATFSSRQRPEVSALPVR